MSRIPAEKVSITVWINHQQRTVAVPAHASLLDVLREDLKLTGAKRGCDRGSCGACTVLVDDRRICACLALAAMQDGKRILTIEGLANGEELHPLQRAFIEHDGLQCGYCTPGQIMSAIDLVAKGHATDRETIRELMSGNLCRCGAYANIVAAICEVAGI
jgi:xanthine dehydrogenase YagT iron-sulfur-binding subunit